MKSRSLKNKDMILSKRAARDLETVQDFVRYGVSKFNESGLFYGHGTTTAFDEAAYMVLESLQLPIDSLEPYWTARLTMDERKRLTDLIHRRVKTRLPAPYLLNKAYIQGFPFYVDERVLIPRSFIAEILCAPGGFKPVGDYNGVLSVLDLCTGSGCLAIIAAHLFPNAMIDAADLSRGALDVARRNIEAYGLEDRVHLHEGDLFAPLAGRKYDLIITNPPYVDAEGMDHLPPEFEHEPAMALAAGDDGLDIVRRIIDGAKEYLNPDGGMICELGRCGPALSAAYPGMGFDWLSTENSAGEVFWVKRSGL